MIVIASGFNASTVFPPYAGSTFEAELAAILYPGLVSGAWTDDGLGFVMDDLALSESWEFNADSTQLSFRLREGLVWSDGEPIGPADVAFTYDLLRRPETGFINAGLLQHLDSVIALDDGRVSFYFARQDPRALYVAAQEILPRHALYEYAADSTALLAHPGLTDPTRLPVSGPFRVAEWRPGEVIVLEANPRARVPARLRRVVFRIVIEETTRLIELRSGAVDLAVPVSSEQAGELRNAGFRTGKTGPRFYDFIAWNGQRLEAFADPEIRRALSYGIDRARIIEGLELDDYQPAAGPYPPLFARLASPDVRPDPYLPDSAGAILDARGWRDTDGDGVRDKNGRAFRFTLLTSAGRPIRIAAAEIIQSELEKIGIDVTIELLEHSTFNDRAFQRHDYAAALAGWRIGLDPSFLVGHLWPNTAGWNLTRYQSAALDSIIPRALAAGSQRAAAPYWRAAGATIARDRPYAFLWYYGETAAYTDRLEGVRIDMVGFFHNLHEWSRQ